MYTVEYSSGSSRSPSTWALTQITYPTLHHHPRRRIKKSTRLIHPGLSTMQIIYISNQAVGPVLGTFLFISECVRPGYLPGSARLYNLRNVSAPAICPAVQLGHIMCKTCSAPAICPVQLGHTICGICPPRLTLGYIIRGFRTRRQETHYCCSELEELKRQGPQNIHFS